MTQFTTYGEDFPPRFAGQAVEVELKTLPGEAYAFVREQKRKDNFLQAQLGVLGLAIQKLKVDGKTYIRSASRKSRRANTKEAVQIGQNIPQVMDPDTEQELWIELLKHLLQHEWPLTRDVYREVFEEFLEDEDEDEDDEEGTDHDSENPTRLRGVPTQTETPTNTTGD